MEKQGIITGIGNEITPEIDAVINDFIVGGNAIIKGLDWVGNTLNAGMCQLRGYRGVLEQTITTTDKYVYGKFIINFDKDIEDEFYIITTNEAPIDGIINPISITSAGTYYLLLYTNKTTTLPTYTTTLPKYKYPKQAHTSDRARDLIAGGTIDSTATTETASVNTHNTQPNRVANTEYVHKQIEEELDEGESQTIYFDYTPTGGNTQRLGSISIQRRARYCIATISITKTIDVFGGTFKLGDMPTGYIPTETVLSSVCAGSLGGTISGQIQLNNEIKLVNIPYSTDNENTDYLKGYVTTGTYKIGYICRYDGEPITSRTKVTISYDSSMGNVEPKSLLFTNVNYNVGQTITAYPNNVYEVKSVIANDDNIIITKVTGNKYNISLRQMIEKENYRVTVSFVH